VKSDGQLRPRLVKLVENPQLTETLDYVVREGYQVVGHWTPDASSDIMLRGPLIAESHWSVPVIMLINNEVMECDWSLSADACKSVLQLNIAVKFCSFHVTFCSLHFMFVILNSVRVQYTFLIYTKCTFSSTVSMAFNVVLGFQSC